MLCASVGNCLRIDAEDCLVTVLDAARRTGWRGAQ
ncbi:hypothetical protein A2U01_0110201, partial [Trifolium medium]|nr:hypothetical protein [Trifolium medium]